MAIPDYQSIMLPLLESVRDGALHSLREVTDILANEFNLTTEEIDELIPSGTQITFYNRVGWARTYLKKAGLLSSPKRGYIVITPRGIDVLGQEIDRIDNKFLENFQVFIEFRSSKRKVIKKTKVDNGSERTPEKEIEEAYEHVHEGLAIELLEVVKYCSPQFFERIVVDLLLKMGYGGTRKDAGQAIGKSGDGGIDGIIKEDRLGLDIVYILAKRWDSVVGRPEI